MVDASLESRFIRDLSTEHLTLLTCRGSEDGYLNTNSDMQSKAFLLVVVAIPAATASLPRTFSLYAYQNGQRIGCINGYGRFTTSDMACYPFNSDPNVKPTTIRGYEPCSTANGTLVCYEVEGSVSQFTVSVSIPFKSSSKN